MNFLAIPDRGLCIPFHAIDQVTRSEPWEPKPHRGNFINSNDEGLWVTIDFGDSDTHTFYGEDALKVNRLFFTHGNHGSESKTLWTVFTMDSLKTDPGDVPSRTQDAPGETEKTWTDKRWFPQQGKPGSKLWCAMAMDRMEWALRNGEATLKQTIFALNSYVNVEGEPVLFFDLLAPVSRKSH